MIPYIIIIILSLAIIVAVIVTGLRFNESVKRTENKHSLDLNSNRALHTLLSSRFTLILLPYRSFRSTVDPPPNMPAPAPNSLAVGVIISMRNFDPGSSILSFDMEAFLAKLDDDNGPMDADAIPGIMFH
jgi:hypothetical protein